MARPHHHTTPPGDSGRESCCPHSPSSHEGLHGTKPDTDSWKNAGKSSFLLPFPPCTASHGACPALQYTQHFTGERLVHPLAWGARGLQERRPHSRGCSRRSSDAASGL